MPLGRASAGWTGLTAGMASITSGPISLDTRQSRHPTSAVLPVAGKLGRPTVGSTCRLPGDARADWQAQMTVIGVTTGLNKRRQRGETASCRASVGSAGAPSAAAVEPAGGQRCACRASGRALCRARKWNRHSGACAGHRLRLMRGPRAAGGDAQTSRCCPRAQRASPLVRGASDARVGAVEPLSPRRSAAGSR